MVIGDVLKERKKLKAAESESELVTEEEGYPLKRKRKLCKRFNFSSDEAFSDDNINDVCRLKIPKLPDNRIPPVHQSNSLSPELREESSQVTFPLEEELHTVSTPVSRPFGLLSEASHHIVSTPISRPLGLVSKASYQESDAFNNIARALAKIERRLTEIERNQKEILEKLSQTIQLRLLNCHLK
ncbi:hypothetical protein AVEN_9385-1 [Araneus ventricosus]|uniref:Uncharacterized protein n=1 Tax=Araneus ventricosus TaxID=182803 RepID=A0A4Y2DKS9_ARAVE|nr:hypothetical protein AVEN_9385-1 [Araneus ventricosus]